MFTSIMFFISKWWMDLLPILRLFHCHMFNHMDSHGPILMARSSIPFLFPRGFPVCQVFNHLDSFFHSLDLFGISDGWHSWFFGGANIFTFCNCSSFFHSPWSFILVSGLCLIYGDWLQWSTAQARNIFGHIHLGLNDEIVSSIVLVRSLESSGTN